MFSLDPEKSDIRIIFEVLPAGITSPAGFYFWESRLKKDYTVIEFPTSRNQQRNKSQKPESVSREISSRACMPPVNV